MVPPGVLVIVQVPDAGSPLNTTLPVGVEQVGCVIIPTTGEFTLSIEIIAVFEVTFVQPLPVAPTITL